MVVHKVSRNATLEIVERGIVTLETTKQERVELELVAELTSELQIKFYGRSVIL
jgi:hypothetical protein